MWYLFVCLFLNKLFQLQLQQTSDKTLNNSSKENKTRDSSYYHNLHPTPAPITSFHNKNTRQKQNADIHFDAGDLLNKPNKDVAVSFSIQQEKQLYKKRTLTFLVS